MALSYANLDDKTRSFMLSELERDIASGNLFISERLSLLGRNEYAAMVRRAIQQGNDVTFANELRQPGRFNPTYTRRNPKGGTTEAKMPSNAPDTLAEGEFNRYYIRGVCLRATDEGIPAVEVYRAKDVSSPRPESTAKIGKRIDAKALLEDLRTHQGSETVHGVPEPNSGLSVRLP